MTYLWDTDTCIYYLNGNEKVIYKSKLVGCHTIYTTSITIAELKCGAFKSLNVEANLKRIQRLKLTMRVLDNLNDRVTSIFGKIKSSLQKQGIIIGDFDLLIGSFAISNDLILVTNNISHYERIEGIKIENWYK